MSEFKHVTVRLLKEKHAIIGEEHATVEGSIQAGMFLSILPSSTKPEEWSDVLLNGRLGLLGSEPAVNIIVVENAASLTKRVNAVVEGGLSVTAHG